MNPALKDADLGSKRMLYAPNIHQGGGRSLLLTLLERLKGREDVLFVLDARMQLPESCPLAGQVYRVKATLPARLRCEWRLRGLIKPDTWVLCMGNLPPLIAHQGFQQIFVQNRYLIDHVSLGSFPWPVRLRLTVERWWLRSRAKYVQRFIVQTPSMQRLIRNRLGRDAEVLPFAATKTNIKEQPVSVKGKHYDFLYVASGEPHKNHKTLLEAWIKLAEKDLFPSLCLTLDAACFPELCADISVEIKKYGLNIAMLGACSYAEIQQLYRHSAAMIYPSLFESFGLPLIESVHAGLPVLASKLTYVTDVIRPTDQFDPLSSGSIADAVCRFSFQAASLNIDLLTADGFLQQTFMGGAE